MKTEEQKKIIYKGAEGLLRLTHSLKDINDECSFDALQLSDKLLKLLENDNQEDFSKNNLKNLNESNIPFKQEERQNMCNGHSNIPNKTTQFNADTDNEIDILVQRIRGEINK